MQPPGQTKRMLLCKVELGHSFIHQKISKQDEAHNAVVPQKGYDSITVKADPHSQPGGNKLSVALDECVFIFSVSYLFSFFITF